MDANRPIEEQYPRAVGPADRTARAVALLWLAAPPVLALAAVGVAVITQYAHSDGSPPHDAWYGFVLAVALLGAAVAASVRRSRGADATAFTYALPRYWEIGLVLAVIALAAFFRFYRFLEFPPGVWYDEGVNATDSIFIIERDHFTVWRDTNFGKATLYLYLVAASFKTFGYTVFAMRLVPALAGLAAVVAFYFLARDLLGALPALVATALFGAGRWAVTFSRINWDAAMVPLFSVMSVYFFVKAMEATERRRERFHFFMAGGSLAAGLYTYIPFRVVPFVMLFMLAYAAVTRWPLVRRKIPGLIIYAVSFLVVVYPLAQFSLTHQDEVLERTRAVNVFKQIDQEESYEPLRFNIESSIRMMNVTGDHNGRHNIPNVPMLDEITAALFVLGLAVSLWSYRDWQRGSIAVWYVVALVPGILTITVENPSAIRGVGAIPPIYLLVGLAVATVQRALAVSRAGFYAFSAFAVAIVGASVAINYHDFFDTQYKNQQVYDGFFPAFRKVGELVAREGDEKTMLVSRDFTGEPSLPFLGHDVRYASYTPATTVSLPDRGRPVVLVLDERQYAIIPTLELLYPSLTRSDVHDPYGRILYTRVDIPAQDVAAAHELPLTIERDGTPPETSSGRINREWTEDDLRDGPITVTWRGHIWSSLFTDPREITVAAPGPASVEIDGERFASLDGALRGAKALLPGEHQVVITVRFERPGRVEFNITPSEPEVTGGDLLYAATTGDRGFRVLYRDAPDFSGEVKAIAHLPFAVPSDNYGASRTIEYQGIFQAETAGRYGFSMHTGVSSQLYVDGQLVVDAAGAHAAVPFDGQIELDPGQHLFSIQYTLTDRPTWALYITPPGQGQRLMDGSEFTPPSDDYRPPTVASLAPDPTWGGIEGRAIEGIAGIRAIAITADGTLLAASEHQLAFVSADGTVQRVVNVDANEIGDLAVSLDGLIGVIDSRDRALIILDAAGALVRRVDGAFASAGGIGVFNGKFLVASPSGGNIYAVDPDTGDVALAAIAAPETPNRALQPSDAVQMADGTLYITDFERRVIMRSKDGATVDATSAGASGSGSVIPRLAVSGNVVIATEPPAQRVLLFDAAGKQRGLVVFSAQPPVTPFGLAATDDGLVYVAGIGSGRVYRFILTPPEEQP